MTQPESGARRWLQVAVGVAISAALIWFAFRETPFSEVWARIRGMKVLPMAIAVILATLSFPIRIPRWRILLRHEDGSSIRVQPLWHAIAIGFAANNVLPLRLGEVVRIGAVSRLAPVPFSSALASVAVERVLDALAAVALLAVALLVVELPPESGLAGKAGAVGLMGVFAVIGAVAVARWPRLAAAPVGALLPAGRIRDTALGIVGRLVGGLSALGDPRRAIPVVAWSLVLWMVNAAAFWIAFDAFGIEVSYAGAVIVQFALLVGISVPSSPGYAGVFEATIFLTLAELFAVPQDVGLAYAIAFHVLTFIPITLMGVQSMLTTGLSLRGAREAAT